jgi:hypothetical protein
VAGITGFSHPAMAKSVDHQKIHEKARKIYNNTNSAKKREKFLRKQDIRMDKVEQTYSVTTNQDGVGTDKVERDELSIYFSMTEYDDDAWDVFIQWNLADAIPWEGEGPRDQVGIAWDDEDYYFLSDEVWYSDNYVNVEDFSTTGGSGGIDFGFQDKYGDGNNNYYGEFVARFNKDNVSGPRQLEAKYIHTYAGYIDSLTVGFPDIVSISFKKEGGSWDTVQQEDGDLLLISPDNTSA